MVVINSFKRCRLYNAHTTLDSFSTPKKTIPDMGLLFIHKNSCGGVIFVTQRSCAVTIPKVESHILDI